MKQRQLKNNHSFCDLLQCLPSDFVGFDTHLFTYLKITSITKRGSAKTSSRW